MRFFRIWHLPKKRPASPNGTFGSGGKLSRHHKKLAKSPIYYLNITNFIWLKKQLYEKTLLIITALALCAGCKEKNANDARVDKLMAKMTLAEKSDN